MFQSYNFLLQSKSAAKPIIADQARFFSITASTNARQYKSVVSRLVKKRKEYKEGDEKPWYLRIPEEKPKYPLYPYGEALFFKRSDRGLYGGQERGSGYQVSEMGNRTPRSWLPNVVTKRLWSEALNKTIKIRLTSRVLRTITKEGGLDNYLTKEKSARIKELGIFGWKLRYDVLKAREKANKPLNYDLKKNPNGEDVKVFYSGTYKGEPIQLTVGRRKLASLLFPVVRNHTTEPLSFAKFGVEHAKASFGDILKECEGYDMDLSNVSFKPEVSQ
ncbi:hypothetical protein HII12_002433 [Brettanomyces bruxellensis]|uniref:Large ribosomal subunit protein bL28m n=1 Tax=Dekkera bruxellensis TaxID=5007 RepID=A0A8H6EVY7_DEKBR|nr:hypothetical protein HII12_002433 [Brettanomyces bruxellensis]